jgi:hypothetical protein
MGRFASSSWPLASRLFLRRTKMWVSLFDVLVCKIVCVCGVCGVCVRCVLAVSCKPVGCVMQCVLWRVCVTVSQRVSSPSPSGHTLRSPSITICSCPLSARHYACLCHDMSALVWPVCDVVGTAACRACSLQDGTTKRTRSHTTNQRNAPPIAVPTSPGPHSSHHPTPTTFNTSVHTNARTHGTGHDECGQCV